MHPVMMGGHMRSGPCICSLREVSIRLERREQVGWVEQRGTCIASKLLDRSVGCCISVMTSTPFSLILVSLDSLIFLLFTMILSDFSRCCVAHHP